MSKTNIINFVKSNIIPILVLIYFFRYAIPQGIYSITLTSLFYALSLYLVLGCLIVAGLIGTIGYIKSRLNNTTFTTQHKSFLVTSVLGLAVFGISFVTHHAYFHKEFDAEVWKDTGVSLDFDQNLLTPRQRMMEDLVKNHLAGLGKVEVESLLGTPDKIWQPEEGGWNFLYVVGIEKGSGVDHECLLIHFDEKEEFQKHEDIPVCQ